MFNLLDNPQKTAMERNLRLYEELQQTPEGRELWENFQSSGEESFDEWSRKQDYQQQGRKDLAELTASLRPETEEKSGTVSQTQLTEAEDVVFNDIVNDPSGEFASIISEDEEGIGLKTIEELMEEGLTKGQAEANIEMFMII